MVLSPEHPLVDRLTSEEQREAIKAYQSAVATKSDLERTDLAKEKTGVFTGGYAVNPATGKQMPIWIADYVLASYGTGAIMAVPAHDTRDWEFAQKFHLPIVHVVNPASQKKEAGEPNQNSECFVGDGVALNSSNSEISLNELPTAEAKHRITAWLESKGMGRKKIQYKLRDWLFSRQRYWGEPFPIVWKRDNCGNLFHEPVSSEELPVRPPPLDDYKPTAEGRPPLARARSWVELGNGVERETNTMPQWAGSCWYYLRYIDPKNSSTFCGEEAQSYWMGGSSKEEKSGGVANQGIASASDALNGKAGHSSPAIRQSEMAPPSQAPSGVDLYVGGTEHAVLHLLYSRFWHKILFDLGHVSVPEPFFRLVNQGLIIGGRRAENEQGAR
jgi:leucyl-tRNA synthetase